MLGQAMSRPPGVGEEFGSRGMKLALSGSTIHSFADAKVLQLASEPDLKPAVNQRSRCSALPCVKESGTT